MIKLLVIIDIGHGGSDPGASGNGVVEKTANLNTGLALGDRLKSKGVKVIYTRSTDKTISLSERVNLANNEAKKYSGYKIVFVSVHHNAGGGDRGEYIYSIHGGAGKEVAESIGTELNSKLGQQKKCYSKKGSDNKDYYYVIKNTSMPAVIVEVAFLDNKTDVQICDTVPEQKRNGSVIADGILKYYKIDTVDSKPPTVSTSDEMYRIRKTWSDAASQKGAYKDKNGAITECKKYAGYSVFDSKGNNVFSNGKLSVGSKVKITGSKYATGQPIPSWVKSNIYKVVELKSDRALISEINSFVYTKDLVLV